MSGPVCPDCNTIALIETHGAFSCPICGWSGRNPPRKIMDSGTSEELVERTRRLLSLRLDYRLRYVRVDLMGNGDVRSNAVFEIMELLGVQEVEGDQQIRFFIEGKLDEYDLDEISTITGVKRVSVF